MCGTTGNLNNPVDHEATDLDAPDTGEPPSAEPNMPILNCSVVEGSNQALYDWTQLEATQESGDILLAEDGLQMHGAPLECDEHQCFALSIDLNESDIHRWSIFEKPEEVSYLASVGKRARAEVSVKNLAYE